MTSSWQSLLDYNSLWIVDSDPQNLWFSYFDLLTQLELSRQNLKFQNQDGGWIFSGTKYLPANLLLVAHLSENSVSKQQKIWQDLGSPKTLIFSTLKKQIIHQLISISPDHFVHIEETP